MSRTILVIDDDASVRYAIRRVIEEAGFAVELAANGKEGLAVLDRISPVLVITDLIMPEREGLETIMELRKRKPELPIVAISGGGPPAQDYLHFARRLGANEILAKPFEPEQLIEVLNRQLPAGGSAPAGAPSR